MYHTDMYDLSAYYQERQSFIESKMKEQRQEALKSFKSYVRQDMIEDFSKILVAAYQNGSPEAERITSMFGFNQSDLLAIDENLDEYTNYYKANQPFGEFYE